MHGFLLTEGKFRALLYRITAYYYNIINMLYFLSRVYIKALLLDEDLADKVWEVWSRGDIDDVGAMFAWWMIAKSPELERCEFLTGYN